MKAPSTVSDWRAFKDKALQRALADLAKHDPEKHARVVAERPIVRQRYLVKRQARAKRQLRMVETLLRGHTQTEIAKLLDTDEATVSHVLGAIFPFPSPGHRNRYIMVRLSPEMLRSLDELASRLMVDRMRALELFSHAGLEDGAKVAKRTLGIRSES